MARRSRVDEQGVTHLRYGQTKNGLPVVGEELLIHVASDGTIIGANAITLVFAAVILVMKLGEGARLRRNARRH